MLLISDAQLIDGWVNEKIKIETGRKYCFQLIYNQKNNIIYQSYFSITLLFIFVRNSPLFMSINNTPSEQSAYKQYYKNLHQQLQKLILVKTQTPAIKNRTKSYLVTLLKGNQHIREIPKDLKGKAARQLRLLAIDRSLTESMHEFSAVEKKSMSDYANQINEERDRETNFGDALRDLVRLARLNNIAREHSRAL